MDIARAWRGGAAFRTVEEALSAPPDGDAGAAARAARALLDRDDWLGPLVEPLVAALRDDPWFEPPLRVGRDPLRLGAVLYDGSAATLGLTVLSADALAAQPVPATVIVPGRVTVVRYLRAGGARLRLWHAERVGAGFSAATARPCRAIGERPLADGLVLRHDGRVRGHQLTGATGDVVTLTATIRTGAAPLMREYRVADGALLRTATLDDGASRAQMLLTLLRVTGRADAAGCFDAASRHPAFFLRWSAMREWLATDWRAARPRLAAMAAGDPHAEVRAAARVTLRTLMERERCAA